MGPTGGHLLSMRGIVKAFPGTVALDGVDFDVRGGEVHALIGENGAGKSTLMNVLAGRFDDYAGRILFDGRPVRITSPRQALRLGIAVLHQERNVVPGLTVAENILLGDERAGRFTRRLDRAGLVRRARACLERLGFDLEPGARVGELSAARQAMVEIAGAVRRRARLFVFDEPTASLGRGEVERLFRAIGDIRDRGMGVVYITHRLGELERIADRVTVLRDGRAVVTRAVPACSVPRLVRDMLGREIVEFFPEKTNRPGEVLLEVRGLARRGLFEGISFTLRRGEILGIAGLVGSGRSEIARAIVGAEEAAGSVAIRGAPLPARTPRACLARGIGFVPEDRKRDGIIAGRPVGENLTIGILGRLSARLGWLSPRKVRGRARAIARRMEIEPPRPEVPIESLSGGNQQKAVVGRSVAADPEVVIFDEPTQGIDVGTKAEIYRLIVDLARGGRAVILISSEFVELVELADRVLIVREGRLVGEVARGDADEDALLAACMGESRPR